MTCPYFSGLERSSTSRPFCYSIFPAMSGGEAESGLEKAQQLMKTVEEMSTTDLPNKREFIASIHSCMGNAYLEMGEAQLALEQHLSDLQIAEAL